MMNSARNSPNIEPSWSRNVQLFWVRRRWVDVATVVFCVAVWLAIGWGEHVPVALEAVQAPQRQALYQIIATISGTMAGFTLTSVSVLINLMRTPLRSIDNLLTNDDKQKVGDVVVNVLPTLGLIFVLALLGLLADSAVGHGRWWIQALVMVALGTSFLGLCRIVWVLRRLLVATT